MKRSILLTLTAATALAAGLPAFASALPPQDTRTSTNLYAMSSPSLVGRWQATEAAILEMLSTLYSQGGAAPEAVTGRVYLTFDAAGTVTITYDELQMLFPASTKLPPVTLRGQGVLRWTESAPNVLSFTGQSYDLEAEVLGMALPAPPVEMGTSTSRFEIAGNRLSFRDFNGPVYLPGAWTRL